MTTDSSSADSTPVAAAHRRDSKHEQYIRNVVRSVFVLGGAFTISWMAFRRPHPMIHQPSRTNVLSSPSHVVRPATQSTGHLSTSLKTSFDITSLSTRDMTMTLPQAGRDDTTANDDDDHDGDPNGLSSVSSFLCQSQPDSRYNPQHDVFRIVGQDSETRGFGEPAATWMDVYQFSYRIPESPTSSWLDFVYNQLNDHLVTHRVYPMDNGKDGDRVFETPTSAQVRPNLRTAARSSPYRREREQSIPRSETVNRGSVVDITNADMSQLALLSSAMGYSVETHSVFPRRTVCQSAGRNSHPNPVHLLHLQSRGFDNDEDQSLYDLALDSLLENPNGRAASQHSRKPTVQNVWLELPIGSFEQEDMTIQFLAKILQSNLYRVVFEGLDHVERAEVVAELSAVLTFTEACKAEAARLVRRQHERIDKQQQGWSRLSRLFKSQKDSEHTLKLWLKGDRPSDNNTSHSDTLVAGIKTIY